MSYTKQTWTDGDTTKPVSAARMQHIEDGLDAVANGGSITAFTNYQALRQWWVNMGGRHSAQQKVLVCGNSVMEGEGADSWATRFPVLLQEMLRARVPQPSGVTGAADAYLTRSKLSPIPTGVPYTESGTVSDWSQGLGGRGWHLGTGGTVTITVTCTRLKVDYTLAGGGGVLGIQLDGGTVTTINTFNATQQNAVWDSGALSAGSHTLVLTRDASSGTNKDGYVNGVQVFNGDEAAGVSVYGASKYGVTAQGYCSGLVLPEIATIGGFSVAVMGFGENDTARTQAQFQSDLQTIITNLRTEGFASSILLVHTPLPGTYDATEWAALGAAKKAIAVSDSLVAYCDLSQLIPGYDGGGNSLGLYYDTKHFNTKGQTLLCEYICNLLMPNVLRLT